MRARVLLLIVCGLLLGQRCVLAEDAKDPAAALRAKLDASVKWNEFDATAGEFQSHLVHRWTNNERDPNGQGLFVVWTQAGRPAAFASVYPWTGRLVHELETVSRTPLSMSRDGHVEWRPTTGLEYRPIPDAPVPDIKPVARLREMKELADRFKVTMLGWNRDDSDREELRRLPKEFFRQKPEAGGVLDGAVFGFVKGTDPEAVLMIEAVLGQGDKPAGYEFAFARATSGGLEARLGDEVVWTVEKHTSRRDPTGLSFSASRPLEE
jgi:hypothetical protein